MRWIKQAVLLPLIMACLLLAMPCYAVEISMDKEQMYQDALRNLRIGNYAEAIDQFTQLDVYENSVNYLIYAEALDCLDREAFSDAKKRFEVLAQSRFEDSEKYELYASGREAEAEGDYELAEQYYKGLGFRDSNRRLLSLPTPAPTPTPTPVPTSRPTPTPVPYRSIALYPFALDVSASNYYVSASHPEKNWRYLPKGATDGDLGSSWTVRNPKGKWLELKVTDGEQYRLAGFRMVNGLNYNNNTFAQNARITQLLVYCDGQLVDRVATRDSACLETYWLREPAIGSVFRFEIESYVSGWRYSDCGICELELLGVNDIGFSTPGASIDEWGSAVRLVEQAVMRGDVVKEGSPRYAIMGLQVLLKEGFRVLQDEMDGIMGPATESALAVLMTRIQTDKGVDTSRMAGSSGAVDAETWQLMMEYAAELRTK